MIQRRAKSGGITTHVGNHTFRATRVTAYLKNGGTLEKAAQMAIVDARRDIEPSKKRETPPALQPEASCGDMVSLICALRSSDAARRSKAAHIGAAPAGPSERGPRPLSRRQRKPLS
jgi:hypothetical protein